MRDKIIKLPLSNGFMNCLSFWLNGTYPCILKVYCRPRYFTLTNKSSLIAL